ncbi:H/ACA ribonucleoprotein complex subunit 3 [Chionoecetes opilio]|uniref:Nucleolar protein 10 n=1 Tax=Chionoecetes opilio TaxID=41210 RepID=A0A8J4YD97_CHIOP|nr:H/ACA ribonucleoprotein complex subunit 3 [Chionoecetes opilio]
MHEVRKKFADLRSVFKGRTAKYKKHLKDPGADPSSLKPFTDIEKLYMKMLEQIEGGASQPEPFSFEEVQENSSEPDKVPARFTPEDKYSYYRIQIKRRFKLLLTQKAPVIY